MVRIIPAVLYSLALLTLGYVVSGPIKTSYAQVALVKQAHRIHYVPTLEVFKDPHRSVYCYRDEWAGISVALSCVYVPPSAGIQKGNHGN